MSEMAMTDSTERSPYLSALDHPRMGVVVGVPEVTFEDLLRRTLDITVAVTGLIFLLPILVVLIPMIKLQDGGPILFAQARMGKSGKVFQCLKFRTMVVDAQARLEELLARDPAARLEWERDHKLRADPRITKFGAFLRKSSIDEIPQLLNVLLGDMSIVGPRPIVRAEVSRYASRFSHYCRVKPGVTGLWQISGRNDTTYRRRVALDTLYVRKRTILMDLRIILATIPAVLQSKGSY